MEDKAILYHAKRYTKMDQRILNLLFVNIQKTYINCLISYDIIELIDNDWKKKVESIFNAFYSYHRDFSKGRLLGDYYFNEDDRNLSYSISPEIGEYLLYLKDRYQEDYEKVICINSPSAYYIYSRIYMDRLLKEKKCRLDYDDIKIICGYSQEAYPNKHEFRRTIIIPAIKEINEIFDVELKVSTEANYFIFSI